MPKDPVMLITAPNISWGLSSGSVMYQNSWYRLRMPSTAAASYRRVSMFLKPAMKDRKPAPKLIHSTTTTAAVHM